MHSQGVFAEFGPHDDSDFPNALEFERTALSLPIFPGLSEDEQDRVATQVLDILET